MLNWIFFPLVYVHFTIFHLPFLDVTGCNRLLFISINLRSAWLAQLSGLTRFQCSAVVIRHFESHRKKSLTVMQPNCFYSVEGEFCHEGGNIRTRTTLNNFVPWIYYLHDQTFQRTRRTQDKEKESAPLESFEVIKSNSCVGVKRRWV